ncbi:MAG TPA: hypothetical protein VGX94_19200 [Terriglobia bacterium]|nr:hypothetical protein [Terriglobia bacterium]
MYKRLLALGLLLAFSAVFLLSCGSSSKPTPSGPAPLTITIGDVPLCGLLSFRTLVNGLTLVPQGGSGVEVLTANQTVPLDFSALRDASTILSVTSIQPGTYTEATITLIAPAMSLYDPTANPPVVPITPTFSSESITFNINPALVVPACPVNSTTACPGSVLQIDFNLAQSIPLTAQGDINTTNSSGTSTITVTPVITGAGLTASGSQGFGVMDDIKGYILSVNNTATSSGNTQLIGSIDVQTLPGLETTAALQGAGQEIAVYLPSAKDLIGVPPILDQLTTGNFVEVNGYIDSLGNFIANSVMVEDQEDIANFTSSFEGYVLSVAKDANGNPTQFQMTVTDEYPNTETGAVTGNPVPFDTPPLIVNVSSSTGWHLSTPGINFGNLTATPANLAVGQKIIVHGTYVPPPTASAGGAAVSTTLAANNVYFPIQTVSGNYVSLLAAGSDNLTGGFVLSPCASLYQGRPIYVITNGLSQSGQLNLTQFVNLNGLASLTPAPQLLARGILIFDQAGGPLNGISIPPNSYVLLADKVHQL